VSHQHNQNNSAMFIKQLYTGCLSEAAYYIDSDGEAAILDPLRDTGAYLELAAERTAKIKYIFETHFHADFISGHLDLAEKTGAPIVYGPNTKTKFPIHLAHDGESFKIGKLTLEVIHTPGHTLESTCYLLKDEQGKPYCLFTGDTLFVGDVGRPDLSSGDLGKEDLAAYLFDSLQKLKQLPDDLIVYPAHGPGSSCGKNLGPGTSTTIGEQKTTNYAMQTDNKVDFIDRVTEGLEDPPRYFMTSARINREGYAALDEVMDRSNRPLSIPDFKEKVKGGAWILDARSPESFMEGFVPESVNIGLKGRFAEWVGILIPFEQPVVVVTTAGEEEETIIRMARVGFDNVHGYLEGGFEGWRDAGEQTDMVIGIEPDELLLDLQYDQKLTVVDVRKPAEFNAGHVKGAMNLPLDELTDPVTLSRIDEGLNLYVHCQGGYRSMIACSLLKREGFHNLYNVMGGFEKMSETPGMPVVTPTEVLH
jgi:glyoxylase-like metal-dependent hydrolase (beta-lactamase superfamily II)/rhodanese-related sulfurtransferase